MPYRATVQALREVWAGLDDLRRGARCAKRSDNGATGRAGTGAARAARMVSTLADETSQSRLPNCRPSSLPASIHRKTVGRDLLRIRAASCTGISTPGAGGVAEAGGVSQAVRMASRWAEDNPASASSIAATARRVWGAIFEGVGVFMPPLYEV